MAYNKNGIVTHMCLMKRNVWLSSGEPNNLAIPLNPLPSPHIIAPLTDYCLVQDNSIGKLIVKSRVKALYLGQQPICKWCGKNGLLLGLPLPNVHEAPMPNYACCGHPIDIDIYQDHFYQVIGTNLHTPTMQRLWLSVQKQWLTMTHTLKKQQTTIGDL